MTKARQALPQKRKQSRKPRPKPIFVGPMSGNAFSEVRGQISFKLSSTEIGAKIKAFRKTPDEAWFWDREQCQVLLCSSASLGESATVLCVELKANVELRDPDHLTTVEEVTATITTAVEQNMRQRFLCRRQISHGKDRR